MPAKDAEFTLYEDEGTNYNYEKGFYLTIKILYSDAEEKLSIEKRNGQFPGMLAKKYFRIKYITKEKALPLGFDKKEGIILKYSGDKQTTTLK